MKYNKDKETVRITLEIPKEWVQVKRKEAKEQGVVWSTYAREQILKSLKTKKYTR